MLYILMRLIQQPVSLQMKNGGVDANGPVLLIDSGAQMLLYHWDAVRSYCGSPFKLPKRQIYEETRHLQHDGRFPRTFICSCDIGIKPHHPQNLVQLSY